MTTDAARHEPMSPELDDYPYIPLRPVAELTMIRDVPIAKRVRFGRIIVTGPPGAGKSTMVRRLGGWPEEGYVDLASNHWWRSRLLTLRPREVHLGFPFVGREEGMALFDAPWLAAYQSLELDCARIRIPPAKRYFWCVNWRARYAFEFVLPPPDTILHYREARARQGTHAVDEHLDPELISAQVRIFALAARVLHLGGMTVHLRQAVDGPPLEVEDSQIEDR